MQLTAGFEVIKGQLWTEIEQWEMHKPLLQEADPVLTGVVSVAGHLKGMKGNTPKLKGQNCLLTKYNNIILSDTSLRHQHLPEKEEETA